MAETLRVGIIGAGWPGGQHAKGYSEAGGFKIVAVADLIPARRQKIMSEFGAKEYTDANELVRDKDIDVISVCLPTHLHAPITLAALRAGKHVVCEKPPAMNAAEAKKIHAAAQKAKKVLLYGTQRRFGGAEQAAKQAIAKGMAGDVYHARATWMRTRGIPIGTHAWFIDHERSGGGCIIDIGVHMLDLGWYLLGQPKPISAFGITHHKFGDLIAKEKKFDVEDSGFALIRFEGGKSLEIASSWALNQPPQQQGNVVRVFGTEAAIDVYTPQGATIYRNFNERGDSRASVLKPPKTVSHVALMRHFKECIQGKAKPIIGSAEGVTIMQMVDGIYKSNGSGKSAEIRG